MNVRKEEDLAHSFILTPTELEKLCEYLNTVGHSFFFTTRCADKVWREFPTLQDLIAYENTEKKEILFLSITVWSEDRHIKVSINFHERSGDVSIGFEGPEEILNGLTDVLEERLSAMKPWYSFILPSSNKELMFYSLVSSLPISGFFLLARQYFSNFLYLFLTLTIVTIIVNLTLGLIKRRFFPAGVFTIGQGEHRHQNNERIRTTIIIGFLVSFVSSIIAGLMLG